MVLLSIDTLRADHLGCYGYDRPTSPTIDLVATQGTTFEHAFAPSPWTLPSHAAMLTGRYPHRAGVRLRTNRLPEDIRTLAGTLRDNGYITSAIVNSHWLTRGNGLDRGFAQFDYVVERGSRHGPSEVHERAIRWLSQNQRKPFFLFLHFYDVHSAYGATRRYTELFRRPESGQLDGRTWRLEAFRQGRLTLTQRDMLPLIDLYDASIRQLDDALAQLFKAMKRIEENTLLIVTSDHGEEFLEHGGVLHGRTFYDEIVRVPLIMRGPGIPPGRRISSLASIVDIVPTVLGALQLPPPASLDGIDLMEAVGAPGSTLRTIFGGSNWVLGRKDTELEDTMTMVLTEAHKLIIDSRTETSQLFSRATDPGERTNIAPSSPETATELTSLAVRFRERGMREERAPALTAEEIERLRRLGYLQ